MDDESKQLLREIRDLQKDQMELLRANMLPPLLRFRFGLRALLIALTLAALFFGFFAMFARLTNDAKRKPQMAPVKAQPVEVPSVR